MRPSVCVPVALLLAACTASPPAPSDLPTTDGAVMTAPAGSRQATTLDAALVVSTNEPFWTATIEGDVMTLEGIGVPARQLRITASHATGHQRTVRAGDAHGSVEAVIVARDCEDDMSAARYPLTAALRIDTHAPVNGCARPAWMPPPPEPAGSR